jgi:DNA anti-recombination protein RmuC
MSVHILRMYNSKHPCTWDESLPYVQHRYNIYLHISIGHIHFQVCLGFQPLVPIDVTLPIAAPWEESPNAQTEVDQESKFVEHIQHIQKQVHDIVQKANTKYKQSLDQHRVPQKFKVGDKMWLNL